MMTSNFLIDTFALHSFLSSKFIIFQFITYMFLHAGFDHIFGNMLGLFFFGPMLERIWGAKRFLFFYLFCGIGAGLLHLGINFYETKQLQADREIFLQNPTPAYFTAYTSKHIPEYYVTQEFYQLSNEFEKNADNPSYVKVVEDIVNTFYFRRLDVPTLGASGAIFGILMAFGLLFPNTEILLYFLFPIKAKYFVFLYGMYELYSIIKQAPGDSVAHFAHLGGMLFAFILIRYWGTTRNRFY